ncbi:small integral membrane protein 12 [Crotalus adamanteus]|uniref:Small integral membrane protein 12 n=1 Tax=Crotalus adamanteus TaxID=8729 RepID=A0AAW1AYZ5_CROAD
MQHSSLNRSDRCATTRRALPPGARRGRGCSPRKAQPRAAGAERGSSRSASRSVPPRSSRTPPMGSPGRRAAAAANEAAAGSGARAHAEPAGGAWPGLAAAPLEEEERRSRLASSFVVGVVGYNLEWFIRGKPPPQTPEDEKSISERREDRKLQESVGKDLTQVVSLKDKLEFAPKAVLNRNRPEKN